MGILSLANDQLSKGGGCGKLISGLQRMRRGEEVTTTAEVPRIEKRFRDGYPILHVRRAGSGHCPI
jgi:hypothetical protein